LPLKRPWRGLPWLLSDVGVVYDTVDAPITIETAVRVAGARACAVVSGMEAPRRFK